MPEKKKWVEFTEIVERRDDNLYATLKFRFTPDHTALSNPKAGSIRLWLETVLTHWAKTTKAGRKAWDDSSGDFNVGDLNQALGDASLKRLLRDNGCLRLTVRIDDSAMRTFDPDWVFDTVLMDPESGN